MLQLFFHVEQQKPLPYKSNKSHSLYQKGLARDAAYILKATWPVTSDSGGRTRATRASLQWKAASVLIQRAESGAQSAVYAMEQLSIHPSQIRNALALKIRSARVWWPRRVPDLPWRERRVPDFSTEISFSCCHRLYKEMRSSYWWSNTVLFSH